MTRKVSQDKLDGIPLKGVPGMQSGPVNELGVVCLFALLSRGVPVCTSALRPPLAMQLKQPLTLALDNELLSVRLPVRQFADSWATTIVGTTCRRQHRLT